MADHFMCEAHEQRLQNIEKLSAEFAAHTKSEEYRFQMISDQITIMGEKVTRSIDELGKRVDGLSAQTSEHHEYLKTLTEEKAERDRLKADSDRKKKLIRRAIWGGGGTTAVAILTAFGTDFWTWLREAIKHLAS